MDVSLAVGLGAGLVLGLLCGVLLGRARAQAAAAGALVELAQARQEAAQWQARHASADAQVQLLAGQRNDAEARYGELLDARQQLSDQFKALSAAELEKQGAAVDSSVQQRLEATELLLRPLQEQLDKLSLQYHALEKDRTAQTAGLKAQVDVVQQASEALRRETHQLVTALRKPQVRGAWGETQLKRVVEAAGMVEHCDFETQTSAVSSEGGLRRPDLTVKLTDGRVIYVDAKAPLSSLLEAPDLDNAQQEAKVAADFGKHVRAHIDQLGEKHYWDLGGAAAPEFVILFLPGDGLLLQALAAVPDLYDVAAKKGIVLASPSTLIAMLRTVEHTWRQVQFLEGAEEVRRTGVDLYDRLRAFATKFAVVGGRLDAATKAYNESVGTFQARVMPKARRFEDLKVATGAPLVDLPDAEGAARELALPELAETPSMQQDSAPALAPVENQWMSAEAEGVE